jgi:hypothetical protein
MNRPTLGMHTSAVLILISFLGGCPSDDDAGDDTKSGAKPDTNNTDSGTAGSNAPPSTPSDADEDCDDDSTVLLPGSTGRIIGSIALDADTIYYSQGSGESDQNGIFRLPKAGGEPARIGEMDNLIDGGPIFLDGDDLYYGDSSLSRIKKDGSGAPEMLFEATGNVAEITGNAEAIYFVHGNWCCESLGTDTTQHLARFDKATGDVTDVLTAADISSIAVDGDDIFWIGSFDKEDADAGVLDEAPRALMRTPLGGGESTVLFQAKKDMKGPNPGSAFGIGLAVADSEVVFGSIGLSAFDTGVYRIAKNADHGTPTVITEYLTFNAGFLIGSAAYTSNGDAIDRIALADGAVTQVACASAMLTPTYLMAHDDAHIYYVRHTRSGTDGEDIGQELRAVALPK